MGNAGKAFLYMASNNKVKQSPWINKTFDTTPVGKPELTYDKNSNEACQGSIPVTVRRGLANQYAVENEVPQT